MPDQLPCSPRNNAMSSAPTIYNFFLPPIQNRAQPSVLYFKFKISLRQHLVFTMFANILQMKFYLFVKYCKYLGASISIRRCNLRAVSIVIVIVIVIAVGIVTLLYIMQRDLSDRRQQDKRQNPPKCA